MWGIFHLCWIEWENLPPTENNLANNIEEIRKISITDVVTSAKFSFIDSIRLWLDRIGIGPINIICKKEKAGLDYDIFIDDSPDTVLSISKRGKMCLLYDQPWNRNVNDKNIIRIDKLSEAVTYIKKNF